MIYKLTFDDERIDWCTAKDPLHLLKSYDAEYDFSLQDVVSLEEISDDEAKTIMIFNTEFDADNPDDMEEHISLYDLSGGMGDDFSVIASTEFD